MLPNILKATMKFQRILESEEERGERERERRGERGERERERERERNSYSLTFAIMHTYMQLITTLQWLHSARGMCSKEL